MQQYGKVIARLRKEHNMTQAELGAKLNVTYQAVSKWENDLSQPDFSTMAQIAELFGVPLTVFAGDAAVAQPTVQTAGEAVIGYCTVCGNAVYSENVAQRRPALICKDCAEADARAKEEERRNAIEAEASRNAAETAARAKARDRGLLWGILFAVLAMAGIAVGLVFAKVSVGWIVLATIVGGLFFYTFGAQMFWDGFIFETCVFGGKIVGMPGVIFSLDLDGIIFLVAMKILFAILRMLIFVVTFLFFAIIAVLVSPFTFFPALIRVSRHGLD